MIINPKFKSLIPPLSPEEFAQLEKNLIADGCRDPLVTWIPPDTKCDKCGKQWAWLDKNYNRTDEGLEFWALECECGNRLIDDEFDHVLIDGHNRYAICERHGLKFKTVEMEFDDEVSAMDWMDANQLGRRNLTPDQRSILRGRRYNRTKKAQGAPAGNANAAKNEVDKVSALKTAETLAAQHHVTERTIRRDGKRAEAIEKLAETQPEQAQAVMDGKKRFNEVRRDISRAAVQEAVKLPGAKFRVVYADPPWKYGDKLTEDYGGTQWHYPSMTISELCEMPIASICEDNAVLFMWVTSPLLFECAPIIKAWGFGYKTSFVWDKVKHNMGHYNSVRHEFLLVCTRGSCVPDVAKLEDSVQSIERTDHSVKPERFREIIEMLYTHGKRIELFARKPAENWAVYGNQIA